MNIWCFWIFFQKAMQLLASQDINWWTGVVWCGLLVDYCDVFSRCLDSHSDGTHSLLRIHWWASDGMLHFSKSVQMKRQTHNVIVSTFFSKFHFLVSPLNNLPIFSSVRHLVFCCLDTWISPCAFLSLLLALKEHLWCKHPFNVCVFFLASRFR